MKTILLLFLVMSCNYANDKFDSKVNSTERAKSLEAEISKEAEPVYIEAYTKVNGLRINIKLANEGTLNKKDVLREYNSGIGTVMGNLKSFSDMQKRIDTAGDAYIQYMVLKAKADIALRKAAEKSYESKMQEDKK